MARDSCARRRFIGWRTLISQNKAKKNLRSLPPNLTIAVIRGKNLECNRAENGCKINKWSCKRSLEGSSAILTSSRQVRISFSLGSLAKAAATSCPSKSSAAPWGHPPISGSLELRTPGCQLKGWIWIGCYQILRNQSRKLGRASSSRVFQKVGASRRWLRASWASRLAIKAHDTCFKEINRYKRQREPNKKWANCFYPEIAIKLKVIRYSPIWS